MKIKIGNDSVEIPERKPYSLRGYSGKDFNTESGIFVAQRKCQVCGHHLPRDQVSSINGVLVHSDVRICLALIQKSGRKVL